MNWTMLGAIGEILGAVGVIVTLGYLATQIKHGTVATRSEAVREVLDQNSALLLRLGSDPQVVDVFGRGMVDPHSLSEEETVQFRALIMHMVNLWERLFHLDRASALDPWIVESNQKTRADLVGAPGFRSWFEARGHWLDSEFLAFLEKEIEASADFQMPNFREAAQSMEASE